MNASSILSTLSPAPQVSSPIITTQSLTVAYQEKPVLQDIDIALPASKIIGIIGQNGSGKTTLLKTLIGLLRPVSGQMSWWAEQTWEQVRHRVSYVPQRGGVDWTFPASVREVVLMGRNEARKWWKSYSKQDYAIADACLEKVGLSDFAHRQIGRLSGGQQQRVFLARALAQQADVYLLDEPFAAVDVPTEQTIIALLKEMREVGKTILVVHHDLATVAEYFDWLVMLNTRLVAQGAVAEVFTPENLQKTYHKAPILVQPM